MAKVLSSVWMKYLSLGRVPPTFPGRNGMRKLGETKLLYYAKHITLSLIPRVCFERRLKFELEKAAKHDLDELMERVDYCNRIRDSFELDDTAVSLKRFRLKGNPSAYYYDLRQYLRYFPGDCRIAYRFGDVNTVPDQPAFVKSRPIAADESNANSILMKFDEIRHFRFVEDRLTFSEKANIAVFRGSCSQEHRLRFVETCHAMPGTDIGDTWGGHRGMPYWKPYLDRSGQLRNKFIISVEGNDVATNLKWILSSNSLCMMTKPRYETWFMEGSLVPDWHYVLLREDYADLPEKVEYYTRHTEEALAIIGNARKYAARFFDRETEKLVSLLVVRKYLDFAGCPG